jgi:hypothetical protein
MGKLICFLKKTDCLFMVLAGCLILFFLSVSPVCNSYANDSAAAIAAGGIQLTRQENISMEKEVLFISKDKVTVDYEFKNLTDKDITTEIAFPIPEYGVLSTLHGIPAFHDFKVFINGKSISYETEIKAFVKGKDVTSMLKDNSIVPETFGGFMADETIERNSHIVSHLSEKKINQLIAFGVFKDGSPGYWPEWTVAIKYHWKQTFPAHKVLSVRHEYKPVVGGSASPHENTELVADCLDKSTVSAIDKAGYGCGWLKYILTTANTWKTPIGDFILRIEPEKDKNSGKATDMKLCWDGPDLYNDKEGEINIHLKNYVPKKELTVLFYYMDPEFWNKE